MDDELKSMLLTMSELEIVQMPHGQLVDLVARLFRAEQNMKIGQSRIHAEMHVHQYILWRRMQENNEAYWGGGPSLNDLNNLKP